MYLFIYLYLISRLIRPYSQLGTVADFNSHLPYHVKMQGDLGGLFSGKKCRHLVCLTLKLGRISCAETSANNYQTTQKSEETSKQCCYLEVRCFLSS
jgi:hypothetical protein